MFTEQFWESTTRLVGEAFRLSIGEIESLRTNPTAKLITALPILAGCSDADRIAAQHLATYLLAEKAGAIFDHRQEDDASVYARIERISNFVDGNKNIIRRGLNLLALSMLVGYENSSETDRMQGVYNPVASGAWDAAAEKTRLVRQIRGTASPEMDVIFDLEVALRGTWT